MSSSPAAPPAPYHPRRGARRSRPGNRCRSRRRGGPEWCASRWRRSMSTRSRSGRRSLRLFSERSGAVAQPMSRLARSTTSAGLGGFDEVGGRATCDGLAEAVDVPVVGEDDERALQRARRARSAAEDLTARLARPSRRRRRRSAERECPGAARSSPGLAAATVRSARIRTPFEPRPIVGVGPDHEHVARRLEGFGQPVPPQAGWQPVP